MVQDGVNGTSTQQAVTVSLQELTEGTVPFSKLEEAFGPDSLGIIVVRDLPERFQELRRQLLSYSSYLANLPEEELVKLESPESHYLVGWSLGKETLKSGQYDTLKGSYYVNSAPGFSKPETQALLTERYPNNTFSEYTAPNVWPAEDLLPGFEATFLSLCNLIVDVAILVARACDQYAVKHIEDYKPGYLEHIVKTSIFTKARLLHYFPTAPPETTNGDGSSAAEDDWCATHLDHGCLTGLTSAMFVDESASPPAPLPKPEPSSSAESATKLVLPPLVELPTSPDPKAGLYIHSRSGQVTKVAIPRDCLGFQTGEALEVITKGKFKAVPHFVRGAGGAASGGKVARNTLAVFTQPNLWDLVDEKRDFGTFAREIIERNH